MSYLRMTGKGKPIKTIYCPVTYGTDMQVTSHNVAAALINAANELGISSVLVPQNYTFPHQVKMVFLGVATQAGMRVQRSYHVAGEGENPQAQGSDLNTTIDMTQDQYSFLDITATLQNFHRVNGIYTDDIILFYAKYSSTAPATNLYYVGTFFRWI